ncbi:hypothetical protein O0880_10530 [Janthinobacterium sp. SUN118]|uniref:hypothetical protein n=1 Tax=Janthinobacterium sp. SUN118 TaxID=3004100 RepID=UPI0025AF6472|nr:hypothetical protein [Janthinobacterium sp. SUN118]MDN2709850.1 hypothetical protein [Janthinobacterium sp. SUN118]
MPFLDIMNKVRPYAAMRYHVAYTIQAGIEVALPAQRLIINTNQTVVRLQNKAPGARLFVDVPGASATALQVNAFVNFIVGHSFAFGQHRAVLNHAPWRNLYNVAPRVLAYMDSHGAAVVNPATDSVPCVDCDILLPINNITIDHQRPQNGRFEEAVCKVFRSIGLTTGRPTGPKGIHFANLHAATVGGVVGGAPIPVRVAKYTLNDMGKIYYTLAQWCGLTVNGELFNACMDHMINLRPLCHSCNTPLRNVAYF